jgi:ribosomal silencing factor RsfS
MGYSGAGGKLIHEKTRSKKSRDTVPLKVVFVRLEKKFWIVVGNSAKNLQALLATAVKNVKRCRLF